MMLTNRQLLILQVIINDFIRSAQQLDQGLFLKKKTLHSALRRLETKWLIWRNLVLLKRPILHQEEFLPKKDIVIM